MFRAAVPGDDGRGAPQFHVEAIRAGLREQAVGGLVTLPGRAWRAVYLEAGRLRGAETDEAGHDGPCFVWRPAQEGPRLRASAGSRGWTLLLGDAMLANILGLRPEAADLRLMLARDFALGLADAPETRADLSAAFAQMLAEQARDRPGSAAIVEAHARIMTVLVWRHLIRDEEARPDPQRGSRLLQGFRQLLEMHFRERWTVARYAAVLGVTTDRLNDLCHRLVGRPPRQLIRERLIYEARLLLERSSRSTDEIAGLLGFADAAQFSKAFKAETGLPPGRYRTRSRSVEGAAATPARSYADWP